MAGGEACLMNAYTGEGIHTPRIWMELYTEALL
jgi:hypothetical protein